MFNLKRQVAEAQWAISSLIRPGEDTYTRWAKRRREHFRRWGNLPTTPSENHRLRALKDKYRGERLFVLGSGPSLNELDLEKLKHEFTFGVNRIYLLQDRISWRPTFYTVNDWEVGPDNAAEILSEVDSTFFIPVRFRGLFPASPSRFHYNSRHPESADDYFSYDLEQGAIMGGSVLTCAIQIGYYLGFDPIYLLGVDVDYKVQETVRQSGTKRFSDGNLQFLESTRDDDPNHFDPRYFGAGKRWHNPNTDNMILGFERCKDAMEQRGRHLLNATSGGKLDVVPRVEFESLFGEVRPFASDRIPTASIVLPAFNAESHIAPAIESVLGQTYEDWELIIIDDGSTDRTKDIVLSYDDARIRYYHQENQGRGSARNAGLERARGEFIAFLDADDTFKPDKLEIQIGLLRRQPELGAVRGGWERIDEVGSILRTRNTEPRRLLSPKRVLSGNPLLLSMTMIRRALIEQGLRFEDGRKFAEDWVFAGQLLLAEGCNVLLHPEIVGCYRKTNGAIDKTTREYACAHIDASETVAALLDKADAARLTHARFAVRLRLACRSFAVQKLELGKDLLTIAAQYRPTGVNDYHAKVASELTAWCNQMGLITPVAVVETLGHDFIHDLDLQGLRKEVILNWRNHCRGNRRVTWRRRLESEAALWTTEPRLAFRQWYAEMARESQQKSPRLYQAGRFVAWVARGFRRHPLRGILALAVILAPLLLALVASSDHRAGFVWSSVVLAVAVTFCLMIVFALARLRNALRHVFSRIDEFHRKTDRLDGDLKRVLAASKMQSQDIDALRRANDAMAEWVHAQLDNSNTQSEKARQRIERLSTRNKQLLKAQKTLSDRLSVLRGELRDGAVGLEKMSRDVASVADRMDSSEQQIGHLRYPKAPRCLVFFGHHKCGSRFFREEIFERIARMTGAKVSKLSVKNAPFHFRELDELDLQNVDLSQLGEASRDVVLFGNSTEKTVELIRSASSDWRALRAVRDPRQVLVSNYFHHRDGHRIQGRRWVWDQLAQDRPILLELPQEQGLLYELDNISKQVIERQLLSDFSDDRILTIKLEDFARDPNLHLHKLSEFFEVADISGIHLERTFANPDSLPWQECFTPVVREAFKARYGAALIALGYEDNLDW